MIPKIRGLRASSSTTCQNGFGQAARHPDPASFPVAARGAGFDEAQAAVAGIFEAHGPR